MTHEQLADRIARLDWSGTSLQHQLAVSAAVGALRGMSAPVEVADNVVHPSGDDADNVVHLKDFFERPENTVGTEK